MSIDIVIKNHLPEWEQLIKELREKNKITSEINIEFSNKFIFNATAKKIVSNDRYLITIDREVFNMIYNFYHSTVNKENPQFVKMLSYTGCEMEYNEGYAKTLADFYVYLTLKFIFLHELGHIMNGHLGYYNSINDGMNHALNMNEDIAKNFNGLSAHEYQMLEINADSFASTNLMIGLLNDFQNSPSYLDRYKKVIPTRNQLFLMSITSNIILMLIQGMGLVKGGLKLTESKYIPKRSRLNEILKVYIVFSNTLNTSENNLNLGVISPLIDAYQGLVNCYLIQCGYRNASEFGDYKLSEVELNNDLQEYITKLYKEIWPVIKPKLAPFAYVTYENLGG